VTGPKLWVDKAGTGYAWGAADIRNSGDKVLSVNQISVHGTEVPFANWYVDTSPARVTTTNFQQALNYTGIYANGTLNNYAGLGTAPANCNHIYNNLIGTNAANPVLCLSQQSGPLSLAPGDKAIVYFQVPTNVLTTVDSGATTSLAMYAGNIGSPSAVTVQSK
jgi:hypothetical protein